MKVVVALAASAFLSCAAPAMAADGPQTASGAEHTAVDPERLALANQMLDAMHIETLMKGVTSGMLKSMEFGDDSDSARQFRASMEVGFEAITPDMKHATAVIYAQTFTVQELRELTAFYSSPTGQAVLAKMPQATSQAMAMVWPLMPKMVDAMSADYCSHAKCGDREQQIFDSMRAAYARMGQRAKSN